MTTADDDASLVARCRAGDGRAWEALVKRYQRLVYTVVGRVGLDAHAAADVFQTVFTRLVQRMGLGHLHAGLELGLLARTARPLLSS